MAVLPPFPNPVNEVAARLVAGAVAVTAVVAVAGELRVLLPVLAYGFVARTLAGPRYSPLALLVTRVVVPSLALDERPVPGPPKRFAQAIGAVFTLTATVLAYGFGQDGWAYGLIAILAVFATLESALALCVGCKVFGLLMRLGAIPDDVCADCNDIRARRDRLVRSAG